MLRDSKTVLEALQLRPGLNVLLRGTHTADAALPLSALVDAARAGLRTAVLAKVSELGDLHSLLVASALGISEHDAESVEWHTVEKAVPGLSLLAPIDCDDVKAAIEAVNQEVANGVALIVVYGAIPEAASQDSRKLALILNSIGEKAGVPILASIAAVEPGQPRLPRTGRWLPMWLGAPAGAIKVTQLRRRGDIDADRVRMALLPLVPATGEPNGALLILSKRDGQGTVTLGDDERKGKASPKPAQTTGYGHAKDGVEQHAATEGNLGGGYEPSPERLAYDEMLRRLC